MKLVETFIPNNNTLYEEKEFSFGPYLKAIRESEGFEQKDIYADTEFTQAHISMLEKGKRKVTNEVVRLYSKKLGVEYRELSETLLKCLEDFVDARINMIKEKLYSDGLDNGDDANAAFT